jgi:hypothetical protein
MGKSATATGRWAEGIGWQESTLGLLPSSAAFARSAKNREKRACTWPAMPDVCM